MDVVVLAVATTLTHGPVGRLGSVVPLRVGGSVRRARPGRARSLRACVGQGACALSLALFAACAAPAAPDWTGRVAVDGRVHRVKVRAGRTYCRGGCPPGVAACGFGRARAVVIEPRRASGRRSCARGPSAPAPVAHRVRDDARHLHDAAAIVGGQAREEGGAGLRVGVAQRGPRLE